MADRHARLAQIIITGRVLDEDDVVLLAELLPRSVLRRRRLDLRDAAIRQAMSEVEGSDYARATQLSRRLTRYVTGASWVFDRREGLPADANPRHRALFAVAQHGGQALGWRQILSIYRGER